MATWSFGEFLAYSLSTGTALSAFLTTSGQERPFYDFYNEYIRISEDCTSLIDGLLADNNHGLITNKIIQTGNRVKPAEGYHRFYLNTPDNRTPFLAFKYVSLIKKKDNSASSGGGRNQQNGHTNKENHYYVLCFSRVNNDVSKEFLTKLFATDEDTVKAIHLDTTGYTNKAVMVSVFAGISRQNQIEAIAIIRDHFLSPDSRYNTKLIISGIRGVGKTYTGGLVKKEIERSFPGFQNCSFVQLFYDFNPTAPGLDIQSEILTKATQTSPVIIIINEIDHIYREVFKDNVSRDGRRAHTQNKSTFNDMLDAITNTKYVIAIFTTEKTIEQLNAMTVNYEGTDEDFQSFYRNGRVDFFVIMTATGSTRIDTV